MSTIVTSDDVQKIAMLARLTLSAPEVTTATQDLSRVLEHFSTIQAIATTDVPTSDDVSGLKNVVREDVARADALCTAPEVLRRAPDASSTHVKVPAVF
jgi:aspartyl-tRNA(Asn)/glutamyl-tRNA(Gln) amidotransferase subunit C